MAVIPSRNENQGYAKFRGGGGRGQTRCSMGDVQMENGLNTVGKTASSFCLKQFEAV